MTLPPWPRTCPKCGTSRDKTMLYWCPVEKTWTCRPCHQKMVDDPTGRHAQDLPPEVNR